MSRDDEKDDRFTFDYRQMYPVGFRNRNARRSNPKPQTTETTPAPARFLPERQRSKIPKPIQRRVGGRNVDSDGYPMPSMAAVAREMWAKNLDLTVPQIMLRLERLGYEAAPGTISSIKQEIFGVLRLCLKHGTITVHASWGEE